jgi:Mg2+-importing ATPase
MLVIGPISSLFDFLTFYILLAVLHADEALFQTGWFIESLTTQVLVIFVIRSRKSAWRGGAHPLLIATSCTVVAIGALLPLTPVGAYFGFVAPPPQFYAILAALVVVYLLLVEAMKRYFYRRFNNH